MSARGPALNRRRFLWSVAALALAGCRTDDAAPAPTPLDPTTAPPSPAGSTPPVPTPTSARAAPNATTRPVEVVAAPDAPGLGAPFTLGVAAGDPAPDGFVIWTRLAPDPVAGGGMSEADVDVAWDVALDEGFDQVVSSAVVTTSHARAHSVHVAVEGLAPGSSHWYRFRVGDHVSPVGHARTLPEAGSSVERFRLAAASCQNYEHGYYAAHRHLATEEVDLVLWLGDYIYEHGSQPGEVRTHGPDPATDLAGYRSRYATYRLDPDLQACHAAHAWISVWDDHEVTNDYAGGATEPDARRAAAYRAWWEHQPTRLAPPTGPTLETHRSFTIGTLATIVLLDTRQHRSAAPCGGSWGEPCAEMDDPDSTMLGPDQESWLERTLADSDATWTILGQQVAMADLEVRFAGAAAANFDAWDGYRAARDRVYRQLRAADASNPVVLTGDLHAGVVADLTDATGPLGTELITPSISSRFSGDLGPLLEFGLGLLDHVKHVDARRRGYLVVDIDHEHVRADHRLVVDTSDPDSVLEPSPTTWEITSGRPGAVARP